MNKQPKKCEYCKIIEDLCWELGEEGSPHHGETAFCEECGAEYYREYNGDDFASNEMAKQNHQELRTS